MTRIMVFALFLTVLPGIVAAQELGFEREHPQQASVGGVESLMGQILAGRIQDVETEFIDNMGKHIQSMDRLRSDARRRNDNIAATCVEQKLVPAQNLQSAASKAAKRLGSIPTSDIEALNTEARTLNTANERVGELAVQARACLRINSGQVVSESRLSGDLTPEELESREDTPADSILPRKPAATPVR